MRDAHLVKGKKQYVDSIEDAMKIVKEMFPSAIAQGSIGAWTWSINMGLNYAVVAEAWIHATKSGWWLRVIE